MYTYLGGGRPERQVCPMMQAGDTENRAKQKTVRKGFRCPKLLCERPKVLVWARRAMAGVSGVRPRPPLWAMFLHVHFGIFWYFWYNTLLAVAGQLLPVMCKLYDHGVDLHV